MITFLCPLSRCLGLICQLQFEKYHTARVVPQGRMKMSKYDVRFLLQVQLKKKDGSKMFQTKLPYQGRNQMSQEGRRDGEEQSCGASKAS